MEVKRKLRAAIYCRLSKEDKNREEESESIQNQKLMLTQYAVKMDWDIAGIYCDEDYSGLDGERPQFKAMIELASKGLFDIVLCKNQSRFSRDMEAVEKYIHGLFPIWGVRFVGVVDNADTMDLKGKKARQINGLINEWYCEDISENVKAAIYTKKKNGQYLGHWCVYGYKLNKNDRHKITPDPKAAEVVKLIFSMYINGESVKTIAEYLSGQKIPTPLEYKKINGSSYFNPLAKNIGKGQWSASTIRKILRDETYIGTLVQGRQKKVSYKSKKLVDVDDKFWITVPNNHEAIISETEFLEAAEIMRLKRRRVNKHRNTENNPFSGKVFCALCKGPLHFNTKNGVVYLRCSKSLKDGSCNCRYIRFDNVETAVFSEFRRIAKNILLNAAVFNDIIKLINSVSDNCETTDNLKKNIGFLEQGISEAYIDMRLGKISENVFNETSERLGQKIDECRKKLQFYKLKQTDCLKTKGEVLEFIENNISHAVGLFIEKIEICRTAEGDTYINIFWNF